MCPPHIGALKAVRKILKPYTAGFLLQFVEEMDVKNDLAGILRTRAAFHRAILDMEKTLRGQGVLHPWGLIGGDCNLCQPCKAVSDEPCPFPEQARPSLEALGVNVLALLETLGMDNRFHEDRITWTGCILFVR
jgi:predicted metal-binding protein